MNDLINSSITSRIYTIRGNQVMIDRDIAKLYGIETKHLIQQVKRNIERFPDRYFFQMNKYEFDNWKSHYVTSKSDKMGLRRAPYCFTEQGIYMIANIIKNKMAIDTSLAIMDAFVYMRHYINDNKYIVSDRLLSIENRLEGHDIKLNELFNKFESKEIKNEYIFYEGEIYDAYSLLLNIISETKEEIIIFDNYINNKILDMIDKNINIIVVRNNNIKDEVIDKYMEQYNNIKLIINNNIHDRYMIIDRRIIYHMGMSLKDIGKKCFSINKLDDSNIDDFINKYIKKEGEE